MTVGTGASVGAGTPQQFRRRGARSHRACFEKCQSRAKNIGMGLRNDSTWPRWYFPEGVMVVALRKHGVGVETIYRRHDHMIDRTGCER